MWNLFGLGIFLMCSVMLCISLFLRCFRMLCDVIYLFFLFVNGEVFIWNVMVIVGLLIVSGGSVFIVLML